MMIRRIQALNYRCLRYIDQQLGNFQVLMGENASGKSAFLDTVAFLGDLITGGLDHAIEQRSPDFRDLVWQRSGAYFELAIELLIPEEHRGLHERAPYKLVRYEVAVGLDRGAHETIILSERVLLKTGDQDNAPLQLSIFPDQRAATKTLINRTRTRNARTVINKVSGGNDNFYSEVYPAKGKGWAPSVKLGPRKSALGNLPEDEAKFPVSTWLKRVLTEGVQRISLNTLLMRKASPPGQGRGFRPDGSNLPWMIENFKNTASAGFGEWLALLQSALPDIKNIRTVERSDDQHRYLVLEYTGGLEIPSWIASDGTLRLLALTLPAYLPALPGIYLIEEPENGIHPRALETIFRSSPSIHAAQIFLASHSPVVLNVAQPSQVLCFTRMTNGEVDIMPGTEHPALRDGTGEKSICFFHSPHLHL